MTGHSPLHPSRASGHGLHAERDRGEPHPLLADILGEERRCALDDCDRTVLARGYCGKHYQRVLKYGDPTYRAHDPATKEAWVAQAAAAETDSCIEWPWRRTAGGYGFMTRNRRLWWITRAVLELTDRPRPTEGGPFYALHSCDNPPCCNPRHLRWGTARENTEDARQRGRIPDRRGERNYAARLTEQDVREMRRRSAAGETCGQLAESFGVSKTLVSLTVRGLRWGHVGD